MNQTPQNRSEEETFLLWGRRRLRCRDFCLIFMSLHDVFYTKTITDKKYIIYNTFYNILLKLETFNLIWQDFIRLLNLIYLWELDFYFRWSLNWVSSAFIFLFFGLRDLLICVCSSPQAERSLDRPLFHTASFISATFLQTEQNEFSQEWKDK